MNKIIWLSILFFGLNQSLQAQTDTIIQRIVLIGDGGELTNGRHPVVEAIRSHVKLDKKTTVLFLGDNLYDTGPPDDQSSYYNAARAVLDSQLSVADNTQARVLMIPGNHDWKNGGRDGYESVIREQLYVDFLVVPWLDFCLQHEAPTVFLSDPPAEAILFVYHHQGLIP